MNFNAPKFAFSLPWFMFDIDNKQLILSRIIPGDISDTKDIILAETPVPGKNNQPINPGGGGNRKISFILPLIKRNNTVGNVLMLKQFDQLRNQRVSFTDLLGSTEKQFSPTPKVLYYWGTGSVPLIYWVKKADPTHKQGWVNELGQPQYSEINMELWLDEGNPLYIAETLFRQVASITGMVLNSYDVLVGSSSNERPY